MHDTMSPEIVHPGKGRLNDAAFQAGGTNIHYLEKNSRSSHSGV
jgi:hypothetical protein